MALEKQKNNRKTQQLGISSINDKSSHPEKIYENDILKTFTKLTRKYLSLFLKPTTVNKNESQAHVFSYELYKILSIFTNTVHNTYNKAYINKTHTETKH